MRHSPGRTHSSIPQPLALARRLRTTPKCTNIESIYTGAHQRTLMPPLARGILLVHTDEASWDLGGSGEARHSCELGVRACGPLFLDRRARCWDRPSEAWPRTSSHDIWGSVADNDDCQARTSRLETPTSNCMLLMPMPSGQLAQGLKKVYQLRVEIDVMAMLFECLAEVTRLLQASRHATYTHNRRHECSQAREKACG